MTRKAADALLEQLAGITLPENYTAKDRHRDFRRVFLETTEGKRVLWQLLEWSHVFRISAVWGDQTRTYFREGERNIGLRLFTTMTQEPKSLPDRQSKGEK